MAGIIDRLGTEIKEGDYIAYGSRNGNHGKVSLALVTAAQMIDNPGYLGRPKVPRLKVRLVSHDWDGKYSVRKTTLTMTDQAVVLHPDGVPQKYKDLLAL